MNDKSVSCCGIYVTAYYIHMYIITRIAIGELNMFFTLISD